jgi:hypothetical protein
VILHDTIETENIGRDEVDALRERVHAIVSAPIEEQMRSRKESGKTD